MEDYHENSGIVAIGLWGKKEEYLHWNNRSYSGEHASTSSKKFC
jgi:hypothetical protein